MMPSAGAPFRHRPRSSTPAGAPDIDESAGGLDAVGGGPGGKKPSGMLGVGNTLYALVRNINGSKRSRIHYSTNYTKANSAWNWATWTFTEFGYPVFVQYGQDFAGGGAYAYVVAHDGPSAYLPPIATSSCGCPL